MIILFAQDKIQLHCKTQEKPGQDFLVLNLITMNSRIIMIPLCLCFGKLSNSKLH